MQDIYGRTVTVTESEGACNYAIDGYEVTLGARDDTKALELLAMFDAPPPAFDLPAAKATAIARIDAMVDDIREAVIGSRATEYQTALTQAQAFAAASYAGTTPAYVKSWLDAKNAFGAGWTAQQAADDIIATGQGWLNAEGAMRALRLLRKEQVRAASDQAGIDSAMAAVDAALASLRAMLGL